MEEKYCTHCNTLKPIDLFGKDCSKYDHKRTICKECTKIINKTFYILHKERRTERNRLFRERNPNYYKAATFKQLSILET